MDLVTAAHMRQLDRRTIELGTPGHVLMERAGVGACACLLRAVPKVRKRGARVTVVAGKGNNGGDGLVVARLLRARGARVEVFLLARAADVGGDALRNLKAWRRVRGATREVVVAADLEGLRGALAAADCVVDAVLGTGLGADIEGIYAAAIEMMNGCGAPVFALDIPSGLDADSGRPRGVAIRATATATFGFAKYGQVLYPGVDCCGALEVIDIGIDGRAITEAPPRGARLEAAAMRSLLPRRTADAHKGTAGHVLVVAGSPGKSGAAILATRAAARGGAGLVTLATPASINAVCAGAVHEAMTEAWPERAGGLGWDPDRLAGALDGKAAVVVGPGLGTARPIRDLVLWLLRESAVPMVLDADALNALARNPSPLRRARSRAVLTPHPGEMGRLMGISAAEVQADRVGVARAFAADHDCVVVLKGARTVIAADGFAWINPTGNPGMASGGMGDALAGLIGALLAQGLAAAAAARLGVYLHGLAGDRVARDGAIGMIASDLIDELPRAVQQCDAYDTE
jgi:NAD(P)H-hydrate epimerase